MAVNWRDSGKSLGLGIALLVGLSVLSRYLSFGWIGIYVTGLVITLVFLWIAGVYTHKRFLKNALYSAAYLSICYVVAEYTLFGLWGPSIITILGFVFFFYMRWPNYIKAKQDCERAIWGKSIKEFKDSGESLPKIRFKLR